MDKPFLQALEEGGLVGDGAIGSLLYERGIFVNRNFDEVNLSQPELVYRIHRDYLLAGAHVIESNTYGANRLRLDRHGLADKTEAIIAAAMDILKRATDGAAYLAGSIGPTGLGAGELRRKESEIREAYAEQAQFLAQHGAHLLMIETFHNPAELRLAVEAARGATELPIVAQVAIGDDGSISDGTPPGELAREMIGWGANVVGANCNGPHVIYEVVTQMLGAGAPVCAYPNAGRPERFEDRLIYLATPENFGVVARRMFKAGVKLVGGCCGTGPSHITRVASAARMVWPRSAPRVEMVDAPERQEPKIHAAAQGIGPGIRGGEIDGGSVDTELAEVLATCVHRHGVERLLHLFVPWLGGSSPRRPLQGGDQGHRPDDDRRGNARAQGELLPGQSPAEPYGNHRIDICVGGYHGNRRVSQQPGVGGEPDQGAGADQIQKPP